MVVQASGARRVLEKNPAAAEDALEAVESAGRTALSEMRRMLEVLRTDEAGVGPQPGLSELERLAAQVREAGLPVDLRVEGAPRELPGALDLAAYRIVQEALNNVVQHAQPAHAWVDVQFAPDSLLLSIRDDGEGFVPPDLPDALARQGHFGLMGIQERALLFGGQVTIHSSPGQGTEVAVRLKTPTDPSSSPYTSRTPAQ
jgi:signal transduction histidine kinase